MIPTKIRQPEGLEKVNPPLMSNLEGSREQNGVLDIMISEFLLDMLITGSSIANRCRIIREQGHHSIVDPETSFLPGCPRMEPRFL